MPEPYEGPERRRRSRRSRQHPVAPAKRLRRALPLREGIATPRVRARERANRIALVTSDVLVAMAALALASAITGFALSVAAMLVAAVTAAVVADVLSLYDKDDVVLRRSTLDESPQIFELALIVAVLEWLLVVPDLGRTGFVVFAGSLFVLTVAGRAAGRLAIRKLQPIERCLVIGDPEAAHQVTQKVECSRACAQVVKTVPLRPGQSAAAVGGVDGLRRIVEHERVERVILAPVSSDAADTLELVRVAKLAGVRVSVLPRLFEVVGSSVDLEEVDGMQMLAIRRFGLSVPERSLKRAFDLVGAAAALVLLSPLFAAIALAIALESGRPVFFRQVRVGRDGRHFCIRKFRTMVPDAEARKDQLRTSTNGLFKLREDPRTTRVGRFLRSTSLDELPQLLNVLAGDMSLVGPRPLVIDEDEQVEGLDRQRLHLTPGMTGPWQVLGSARIPMHEMVGIDYLYVANWTLWNDVKLIVRTVAHVLARRGV